MGSKLHISLALVIALLLNSGAGFAGSTGQFTSNLFTGAPAFQSVFNPVARGTDFVVGSALYAGGAAIGYGAGVLRGASSTGGKFVPNPYGKVGGSQHRAMVSQVVKNIESRGYLAKTEYAIKNAEGRPIRYVDVAAIDPATNQPVEFHQVGRTTSAGRPVARERTAITDIQRETGKDVIYHPYD